MATLDLHYGIKTDINFLSPTGYMLVIDKLKTCTFFIQECNAPGIELGQIKIPTPMFDYNVPSSTIEDQKLLVSFIVDENMTNYFEIYNWMYGLNNPESLGNNLLYSQQQMSKYNRYKSLFSSLFSDIELQIYDNNNNYTKSITYIDAFPTYLGELMFQSNVDGLNYITCNAVFEYSYQQ